MDTFLQKKISLEEYLKIANIMQQKKTGFLLPSAYPHEYIYFEKVTFINRNVSVAWRGEGLYNVTKADRHNRGQLYIYMYTVAVRTYTSTLNPHQTRTRAAKGKTQTVS